MFSWKNGFFDCCGSKEDCLFAFACPCTYACVVADNDDQGIILSILQCFLYPCLIPILRHKARKSRLIEVNFFKTFLLKLMLVSNFIK